MSEAEPLPELRAGGELAAEVPGRLALVPALQVWGMFRGAHAPVSLPSVPVPPWSCVQATVSPGLSGL